MAGRSTLKQAYGWLLTSYKRGGAMPEEKRFWTGSGEGYGQPDDDDQAEGLPIPDDDGMVYPRRRRPAKKAQPRRGASGKADQRKKN